MIIDGVLGSEAIDSSGEVLDVRGADISDVEKGTCLLNWEHLPGEKSATTLVGVVLAAKKIFSREDCENDRQRMYWDEIKLPYIYGVCRLYDGAGHEEAKRIAAIIRDHAANNEPIVCRYSVEGATLRKEDNKLSSSVVRRVAVTVKPCNRTAISGLIEDPNAPAGFDKKPVKERVRDLLDFDVAEKSESSDPLLQRLGRSSAIICNPIIEDPLVKASVAGSGAAAPATLVGGAALQREDLGPKKKHSIAAQAAAAIRDFGGKHFNRSEFRTFAKTLMPEASDEFLDHFSDMAEDYHVKRSQLKKVETVPEMEVSIARMHALDIQLRKAASDLMVTDFGTSNVPSVHSVDYSAEGKWYRAGRLALHRGNLHHLEDYHGLMQRFFPEGPASADTLSKVHGHKISPHMKVDAASMKEQEKPGSGKTTPHPVDISAGARRPRPASVFEYHRAGHDKPHTLEAHGGKYLLDGEELTHPEMQTILDNRRSGAATIRYKSGAPTQVEKIQKMEVLFDTLMKTANEGGLDEDALLQHARAAEAAGHLPAGYAAAFTKHLYEDPMTPGLGNKKAWTNFSAKNKPGTYIQMDGNDFSAINNSFGHEAGDSAIKAFGSAARDAMNEAVGQENGKLFRNGGDEFVAHVPSQEHAALFSRALSQKLQGIAPIGGVHQLSMSYGFGHNPQVADAALYEAKKQKINPATGGRAHKVGQVPNLAHSLVPGSEGALPVHDQQHSMMHEQMKKPPSAMPAAPLPKQPQPKLAA